MSILFVIVLYKMRLFETQTYKTLLKHNNQFRLFVYDNSPEPMHSSDEFETDNIKYVSDTKNSGLSAAYNKAAKYAATENIEWVLLLDQDTQFAKDIIDEYCCAVAQNSEIKLFIPPMKIGNGKYISPVKMFFHTTKPSKKTPFGIVSLKQYTPINSGMLINTKAYWSVNGYNEAVFLDYSDYQFIERFKKIYPKAYVLSSVCHQNFSNDIEDNSSKLKRFELFCRSLKNCEKHSIIDTLGYQYVVLKRTLSLIVKSRSLSPIKILMTNYL